MCARILLAAIRLSPDFRRLLSLLFVVALVSTVRSNATGDIRQPAVRMFAGGNSDRSPARWGKYSVTIDLNNDNPIRICIRDHAQRIVKEVDCGESSQIYTLQLSKNEAPDLVIVAWSGSNLYCTHMTYAFSQQHGVRNLAIICGGDGQFRRLGAKGLEFVMSESGVLEFACDVCHACSPSLPVILEWNNGRTVDVTRRFPALTEASAANYRQTFVDACQPIPNSTNQSIISPAAGYYANEYELGHGPTAYRWVMKRLPNNVTRQWFRYCARVVRYQVSQIQHMTTSSQARVLVTPDTNPFTNPPQFPKTDLLSE